MENVADALKMAGAVLMFVIALSVSIVSFGQARQASDIILNYRDRETVYIDGDYYYEASGTERTVSVETIVPAIYRAYNEQYKIVFKGQKFEEEGPIYKCQYTSGQLEDERYVLDSDFDYNIITIADRNQRCKSFLNAILYGIKDENFEEWYENSDMGKKVILPSRNLYERLSKATKITEYLGVYYPTETADEETTIDTDNREEEVPEANKVEKRIITYVIDYYE